MQGEARKNIYSMLRELVRDQMRMTGRVRLRIVLGRERQMELLATDDPEMPESLKHDIWVRGLDALPSLFGARIDYEAARGISPTWVEVGPDKAPSEANRTS